MTTDSKTPAAPPAAITLPPTSTADTRQAWTVNFTAPKPAAMPADRLRARAEMVRAAMNCGGGY